MNAAQQVQGSPQKGVPKTSKPTLGNIFKV